MDVPRNSTRRRLGNGAVVAILLAAGVLASAAFTITRGEAHGVTVARSSVVIAPAERKDMVRNVRGPGVLVPSEITWVSAQNDGRVLHVSFRPGAEVRGDDVLVTLSNPVLEQEAEAAEINLRAAEASLASVRSQAEVDVLAQNAVVIEAEFQAEEAALTKSAEDLLAAHGATPELKAEIARLQATRAKKRVDIERERLAKLTSSSVAKVNAEKARVEELRALSQLRRRQVNGLAIRAGVDGIVHQLSAEEGQRIAAGDAVAKIARPTGLKAELRIPEGAARDVQVGLAAQVDTRNGLVRGRVVRVAPVVQDGAVRVDVALDGALPPGARADLSVDGVIDIERVAGTVMLPRPQWARERARATVFKLRPDEDVAEQTTVEFGRASVDAIEVVSGLEVGDRVIVSDVSEWRTLERIRLR